MTAPPAPLTTPLTTPPTTPPVSLSSLKTDLWTLYLHYKRYTLPSHNVCNLTEEDFQFSEVQSLIYICMYPPSDCDDIVVVCAGEKSFSDAVSASVGGGERVGQSHQHERPPQLSLSLHRPPLPLRHSHSPHQR